MSSFDGQSFFIPNTRFSKFPGPPFRSPFEGSQRSPRSPDGKVGGPLLLAPPFFRSRIRHGRSCTVFSRLVAARKLPPNLAALFSELERIRTLKRLDFLGDAKPMNLTFFGPDANKPLAADPGDYTSREYPIARQNKQSTSTDPVHGKP